MKRSFQLKLKLTEKVIFVDWHGVVSDEPFWKSIYTNENHPLAHKLKDACKKVFSNENDVLNKWMRGDVNTTQIIDLMNIQLSKRFSEDFLLKRLIADCNRMVCNKELIELLIRIRHKAFIVLATDNMDCFSDAFRISQQNYRVSLHNGNTMKDITNCFDEILCSADLGVLKSEASDKFFGKWLSWHGLSFKDSLLLDDREDNLLSFEKIGGKSVLYKQKEKESYAKAFEIIEEWLQDKQSQPNPFENLRQPNLFN